MRIIILLFAVTAITFSCQNSFDETENQDKENDSTAVFGNSDYVFPELSTYAREQNINWSTLEDMLMAAKNINGSNFQALKNYSEQLTEYSNQLLKDVPEEINTNPIRSRLLVLKTRAELLNQVSHRGTVDSTDLQNSVKEMNTAVTNLIIHLNEKFQKDRIDLQRKENEQRELKGQKQFQDSIFELERQDIKNRNL